MGETGTLTSTLRSDIDAALAAGDEPLARGLLDRLWRLQPGPATAGFVLARCARLAPVGARRAARVAVLRSCTVEPIVPIVRAAGALRGLDLTVQVGGFNTYVQEVLDPSSPLHAEWAADVVIVVALARDVAPELWNDFHSLDEPGVQLVVDRVVDELGGLVTAFRRSSNAPLVLHGLDVPATRAGGVAASGSLHAQAEAIAQVNRRLAAICADTTGAHFLDYDAVVAGSGRAAWYDEAKWASMRMPFRSDSLVPLAEEWLRFLHPLTGRVAKALICDLDNTMWGGVVGEDGIDGIVLGHDAAGSGFQRLQRALLDVQSRGVLLGICSKNNESDVDEVFDRHPEMVLRREHIAASRVNWDNKADNLRAIAAELNIGIDSLAFIDDNPAECALIRRELPEVMVIELDVPPGPDGNPVEGNPWFERLTLTAEDRDRTKLYAQQREREASATQAGSLDDYLRSLQTTVSVSPMNDDDLARAAQLTQKTNQLNVTTRRYTEADVQAIADDPSSRVLVARAADRFGDHGTIGLIITRSDGERWVVDTFLLSCRVIGRGVETAMLAVVVDEAARAGATVIEGRFIPTAKNAPAREIFAGNGFQLVAGDPAWDDADGTRWEHVATAGSIVAPDWINLTTPSVLGTSTAVGNMGAH